MTDLTHIQPTDRISQGPSQIKDIILKVITNCAGTVFPVTDNSQGRLAYITLDSTLVDGDGPLAGWICVFMGLNPDTTPIWNRLINVQSAPPTWQEFQALSAAVQEKITGAASTVTAADLAEDSVVVSDENGKLSVVDIRRAELLALDGVRTDITLQEQVDGKQPAMIYATSAPGAVSAPDGTVWLVYVP